MIISSRIDLDSLSAATVEDRDKKRDEFTQIVQEWAASYPHAAIICLCAVNADHSSQFQIAIDDGGAAESDDMDAASVLLDLYRRTKDFNKLSLSSFPTLIAGGLMTPAQKRE